MQSSLPLTKSASRTHLFIQIKMTALEALSSEPEAGEETVPPQAGLTEEHVAEDDGDEGYASSVSGSETTSLTSSAAQNCEEYGRTYHSVGSTEYWGPNDEAAQVQQDLSHHVWTIALGGKYLLAPITRPNRILDIGTGTGRTQPNRRYD